MTTKWAQLPNAAHIDRVLADLSARPRVWSAALGAARDAARGTERGDAWAAALDAARSNAQAADWDVTYSIAWNATYSAAWGADQGDTRYAARYAALDAIRALIAWDDCSGLLDLPPDAVRLLAASGHYPAVLLYPAVLAFNTETA